MHLPLNHDEAATFFHFVQKGSFLPYQTEPDANNHILNSFLSFISFNVFGDSSFALRLPNYLALLLLFTAVLRINRHLQNNIPKLILFCGFLVSFHWLSFFNISRGYGISMAFLLLAIALLMDYLKNPKINYFLLLCLFIQLAVSANLTLIIATLLITIITWYHQLRNELFNPKNILISVIHLSGILFWIKYSFYLKEHNALYYGTGTNYFNSTFASLVELLSGYQNQLFILFIILISALLIIFNIIKNINFIGQKSIFLNYPFTFSFITFLLVVCIYLLNLIADVNFPEDRTGLFFYVFIIFTLAFSLDLSASKAINAIGIPIVLFFVFHFSTQFNITRHSVKMYATMPYNFYYRLLEEQEKNEYKFTIGGYRMTELSFNFMNYRNDGKLNPMDPYEEIQLHYDYIIAGREDSIKYYNYYKEILTDHNHGFVLLERNNFIDRKLIYSSEKEINIEGESEYLNFYEVDSIFQGNHKSLLAEIDFTVERSEQPLDAWVVFYGEGKEGNFYERYPLNWIRYNWNGKQEKFNLITGKLQHPYNKIIVYLWNIKRKPVKLAVHQTKIYQLTKEEEAGWLKRNR